MRPQNLIVRCLARREGDVFVAMCVDLTLAAQGSTLHEAREKLHAQIASYIGEALTVDRKHAPALLYRKGPLTDRLVYRFCQLRTMLKHGRNLFVYSEALPLKLAAV
ncbi:MAG: hypothetical protein Q8M01_02865 [Rubrivivax sp.]|nr:hypothetical protein [Rubrivivax sp.]